VGVEPGDFGGEAAEFSFIREIIIFSFSGEVLRDCSYRFSHK